MKYLLDTHCWLWWVREPARLGKLTHQTISDPGNRVYLSAASTWEATIKASMGKILLPGGVHRFIKDSFELDGFEPLPALWEHTIGVETQPVLHRDPFDRLLIAQAVYEGAVLITSDPLIAQYSLKTLDAST